MMNSTDDQVKAIMKRLLVQEKQLESDKAKVDAELAKFEPLHRVENKVLKIMSEYSQDGLAFEAASSCFDSVNDEVDKIMDRLGRFAETSDVDRYKINQLAGQAKKLAVKSTKAKIRNFDYDSLIDRDYQSDKFYFNEPDHFAPYRNFEDKYQHEHENIKLGVE